MNRKSIVSIEQMKKHWLIFMANSMSHDLKNSHIMVSQFLLMPYFDFNRIINLDSYKNFLPYFNHKLKALFSLEDQQIRDYYENQRKQSACILALKNKLGWDYVFDQMEVDIQVFLNRKGEKWSYFERWIFFLCTQVKKETRKESFAPTSIILKRTINGFNKSYEQLILSDFTFEFNKKLDNILCLKEKSLNKIFYLYQKALILAIKNGDDWSKLNKTLNLEQIYHNQDLLFTERQEWIEFLKNKVNRKSNLPRLFIDEEFLMKINQKLTKIAQIQESDFTWAFTNQEERELLLKLKLKKRIDVSIKKRSKLIKISDKAQRQLLTDTERQKSYCKIQQKNSQMVINSSSQSLHKPEKSQEFSIDIDWNEFSFTENSTNRNFWMFFLLNQYNGIENQNWKVQMNQYLIKMFEQHKQTITIKGYNKLNKIIESPSLFHEIECNKEKELIELLLESNNFRYKSGRQIKMINMASEDLQNNDQSEEIIQIIIENQQKIQKNKPQSRSLGQVFRNQVKNNTKIIIKENDFQVPKKNKDLSEIEEASEEMQESIECRSKIFLSAQQVQFSEEQKFIIFLLQKKPTLRSLLQTFVHQNFDKIRKFVNQLSKKERSERQSHAKKMKSHYLKNKNEIPLIQSSKVKYLFEKLIKDQSQHEKSKKIQIKSVLKLNNQFDSNQMIIQNNFKKDSFESIQLKHEREENRLKEI